MLDWKAGDKLIAVKEDGGNDLPRLVIGRAYIVDRVDLVDKDADDCCDSEVGIGVVGVRHDRMAYCSCAFRKPIDFKKLCNVKEKETEDA